MIALLFAATTVELVLETYEKRGFVCVNSCADLDMKLKRDLQISITVKRNAVIQVWVVLTLCRSFV